jgi:carboxymethylenebutenolidase
MSLLGETWRASDGAEIGIRRSAPDDGATYPGLIIFPSIFGMTGELAEHADQIAATGAVVLAFNPLSRSDDPGELGESDAQRAIARMGGVDFGRLTRDFRELLAALKQDSACNGRVIGLGICLGGPFVFNAAADAELDGVAIWHGSRMGDAVGRASAVKCPVLMDFGDEDPIAPLEEIAKVEGACAVIDDFTLRVHQGAGHGFSHTGWSGYRSEVMAVARPDLEKMLASLRT